MSFEQKYSARKEIETFNIKTVIELLEKFGFNNKCLQTLIKNSVDGKILLSLNANKIRSWQIDNEDASSLLDVINDMKTNPERYVDEETVYEEFEDHKEEAEEHMEENSAYVTLTLQQQLQKALHERNKLVNTPSLNQPTRNNGAQITNNVQERHLKKVPMSAPKLALSNQIHRKVSNNTPTNNLNKPPVELPKILPYKNSLNVANRPLPKLPSDENIDRIQGLKSESISQSGKYPEEAESFYDNPDEEMIAYENSPTSQNQNETHYDENNLSESSFDSDPEVFENSQTGTEESPNVYSNGFEVPIHKLEHQQNEEGGRVRNVLAKKFENLSFDSKIQPNRNTRKKIGTDNMQVNEIPKPKNNYQHQEESERYLPMASKLAAASNKVARKFSDAKLNFEREPEREHLNTVKSPTVLPKMIIPHMDLSNADKPLPKLPSYGDLRQIQNESEPRNSHQSRSTGNLTKQTQHVQNIRQENNGVANNEVRYDVPKSVRPINTSLMPNKPIGRSPSMQEQNTRIRKASNTQSRAPGSANNISTDFKDNLTQALSRINRRSPNSSNSSLTIPERDSLKARSSNSSSNSSAADHPDYIIPISGTPGNPIGVPIEQEPFFKDIPRETASQMLAGKPDGSFLIRPSKMNHEYTLMVRYRAADFNIKIRQRAADGRFALGTYKDGEIAFSTIQSMIRYYSSGVEKLSLFTQSKVYGFTYLYPV